MSWESVLLALKGGLLIRYPATVRRIARVLPVFVSATGLWGSGSIGGLKPSNSATCSGVAVQFPPLRGLASIDTRLAVLTWMVGMNLVMTLAVLGKLLVH